MSPVHLHLLLNHVPVIGLLFVLLVLGVAFWRRNSETGKLGMAMLAGIAVVTAVVFLTGEPAEEAVENLAGVSEAVIHEHEEAADAALIATSIAGAAALALLLLFRRRDLPRRVMGGTFALVLIVGGLMAWTANLGGQIRHTEIRTGNVISRESEEPER